MPQVIAQPEDMERFASELKQFNEQLEQSMRRLQGQFGRLGETWRDQDQQKFAREFEQTMRVLQQFQRTANEQIPFLQKKARILREFQKLQR